jgi:hypothetical protein
MYIKLNGVTYHSRYSLGYFVLTRNGVEIRLEMEVYESLKLAGGIVEGVI